MLYLLWCVHIEVSLLGVEIESVPFGGEPRLLAVRVHTIKGSKWLQWVGNIKGRSKKGLSATHKPSFTCTTVVFHDLTMHPNQNAALDRSQSRFVCMLKHEFESRFEICVLIGHHITSTFDLCCKILENRCTAFPPRTTRGMTGGHGLGRTYNHIEVFGLQPFPHKRNFRTESLLGGHALRRWGEHCVTSIQQDMAIQSFADYSSEAKSIDE